MWEEKWKILIAVLKRKFSEEANMAKKKKNLSFSTEKSTQF
jgi:hypothetical protein